MHYRERERENHINNAEIYTDKYKPETYVTDGGKVKERIRTARNGMAKKKGGDGKPEMKREHR